MRPILEINEFAIFFFIWICHMADGQSKFCDKKDDAIAIGATGGTMTSPENDDAVG
jgi:hypothetical protein